MNKTKILAGFISLFVLIFPIFVFAQIKNPLAINDIPSLVDKVLDYVVKIGAVVATLAFIWAGFVYVTAQGSAEKLKTAKEIFINTCIGTAILLGASLISKIITGTIGNLS